MPLHAQGVRLSDTYITKPVDGSYTLTTFTPKSIWEKTDLIQCYDLNGNEKVNATFEIDIKVIPENKGSNLYVEECSENVIVDLENRFMKGMKDLLLRQMKQYPFRYSKHDILYSLEQKIFSPVDLISHKIIKDEYLCNYNKINN